MRWLLRTLLLFGIVALTVLAFATRPDSLPAPAIAVAPPTATSAPASSPTPRPTLVPEPIISRITRATPDAIPTRTPAAAGQPTTSIVDFAYLPQEARIRVGQTVTWTNDGRELHDVTGDDWFSGPIEPTRQYRHTFGFAGRFEFRCTVWRDMRGAIVVS
jgi:plastocyanin